MSKKVFQYFTKKLPPIWITTKWKLFHVIVAAIIFAIGIYILASNHPQASIDEIREYANEATDNIAFALMASGLLYLIFSLWDLNVDRKLHHLVETQTETLNKLVEIELRQMEQNIKNEVVGRIELLEINIMQELQYINLDRDKKLTEDITTDSIDSVALDSESSSESKMTFG